MTKINDKPITSDNILEFLQQNDDFALEMRILKSTIGLGLKCSHGGTYIDPVTDKPRQYDIRAKNVSGTSSINFAVECKALSPSYPLVISRVPRPDNDSYNTVSITRYSGWDGAKCHMIRGADSLYMPKQPVGKASNQLGIKNDGSFVSSDSEIYDKWAQAIASCHDLVSEFIYQKDKQYRSCAVFPILVIPEGTLWCVDYDSDGKLLGKPAMFNECDFFIGREYTFRLTVSELRYNISHLHIVTSSSYEVLLKGVINKIEHQLTHLMAQVSDKD